MKKTDKKIGWIIFLLFLLYASSSGNYLNSGDDYLYDNSSWLALIDLVIASVAMMIVPFIWRLINKELLPFKKGKRICMWNSIILFIVSIILSATSEISIIGGIGAVIYYFINKWLFVDYMNIGVSVNYIICNNCESKVDSRKKICPNCELPLEGKELKENTGKFKCSSCGALCDSDDKYCKNCNGIFEDDEEEVESDNYVDESTSNNEKKFICDNCGALVGENEIECPNCGEEFEEEEVDLEKLLETANKNKKGISKRIKFVVMDSMKMTFPNELFDLVSARHTIIQAKQIYDSLRPGGVLIIEGVDKKDCWDLKRTFGRGQAYNDEIAQSERDYQDIKHAGFTVLERIEINTDEYYETPDDLRALLLKTPIIDEFVGMNDKVKTEFDLLKHYCQENQSNKGILLKRVSYGIVAKKSEFHC